MNVSPSLSLTQPGLSNRVTPTPSKPAVKESPPTGIQEIVPVNPKACSLGMLAPLQQRSKFFDKGRILNGSMGPRRAAHTDVLRVREAGHKGQPLEESPSMTHLEQSDSQRQKSKGGCQGGEWEEWRVGV